MYATINIVKFTLSYLLFFVLKIFFYLWEFIKEMNNSYKNKFKWRY